jgi:hypothetical protein
MLPDMKALGIRQSETNPIVEAVTRAARGGGTRRAAAASEPNEMHERAVATERERVQGIMQACRAARLPQSYADRLIADGTRAARRADAKSFRNSSTRAQRAGPRPGAAVRHARRSHRRRPARARPRRHRERAAAPDAPAQRGDQNREFGFKLTDEGRLYRGMTILDAGRRFLEARGIRTTSMSRMDLAGALLGFRAAGSTRRRTSRTSSPTCRTSCCARRTSRRRRPSRRSCAP